MRKSKVEAEVTAGAAAPAFGGGETTATETNTGLTSAIRGPLAKLTNNRYYFDFNATSPLASSVKDWHSSGDFSFANPASFHFSGKKI